MTRVFLAPSLPSVRSVLLLGTGLDGGAVAAVSRARRAG